MSFAFQKTVNLEFQAIECYSCGVWIGMPQSLYEDRYKDHQSFWCPNGHEQNFVGKTEAQKLKEQLAREKEATEWHRRRAEKADLEREHEARRGAAARGQVTKIKNRIHKGVCPFCNRTFSNVQNHMESKHPKELENTDDKS